MVVLPGVLIIGAAIGPRTVDAAVGPPAPLAAAGEISVRTLVAEMADLEQLARLPVVPFTAGQQSSRDRRSRSPSDAEGWFANDDFATDTKANLVRVDKGPDGRKRYVLLDARGPGAVVRIWTATPAGTLRVHIDDDPHPALEADMRQLLSGQVPPFVAPFAQVTAMGYSLYFPFPYRRRCLISVDSIVSPDPFTGKPVDKLYYQIGLRSYRSGRGAVIASIRPYAAAELTRAGAAIQRAGAALRAGPRQKEAPRDHATLSSFPTVAVAAGRSARFVVTAPRGGAGGEGGGTVTRLRLFTNERDPDKLRHTILSIAFDGQETVRSPLVDFFGTGPGWNVYSSLPMTVGADGWLTCRFAMPFRKSAVVSISRASGDPVEISGDVLVDPRPFGRDTLTFHARHREAESIRTRPFSDWRVATLTGRGHLVGFVLNVDNPPGVAWWGEGDEKIYVDGEAFPGIFGTGTEDYFGYAWSSTELFAHPYHAQTRATGPGFGGQFSMNRFHIIDPIPFQRDLRFDLEAWHWSDTTMAMDATIYWYQQP